MKAHVTKVGDQFAIVLPGRVAATLGLTEGQRLSVETAAGGGLTVRVADPVYDKGMRLAEEAMVNYAETFKALAKS